MVKRTFVIGQDNMRFKLNKQDKTNTDELELTLKPDVTIEINDEVEMQLANTEEFFLGLVQKIKEGNGEKVVTVWDYGAELLQRNVNKIYTNQSPEAIIQDVLTNYSTLTYSSTISSGVTIGTYVANKKRAWDIVSEMAEVLLANFYVDESKNFKLELEGQNIITSESIDSSESYLEGRWESDATQIINDVIVDGDDRQIFEREPVTFNGDGSTTEFTLSEVPLSIKVEHPLNTILDGYTENNTSGDYQIIRESKKIIFDTAPASGTGNIRVTYNVSLPISVNRRNAASITTYGQRDKVIKKSFIKTRSEARDYANFIINRYKDPIQTATYVLPASKIDSINTYLPNSFITLDDNVNNRNGSFIIRKVDWEYPTGRLKLTIGTPKEDIIFWQKEIQDKVKQIEEKDDNSTILTQDEFVEDKINITWDFEVVEIFKRTWDADSFYLKENPGLSRNQLKEDGTGPQIKEFSDGNGFSDGANLIDSVTDHYSQGSVKSYVNTTVKNGILNFLTTNITHVAVGDSTTTPTETDTTLGNEQTREALAETASTSGDTATFTMFLDTGDANGDDIEEVGLFNASSGGTMYLRTKTSSITKDSAREVFIESSVTLNTFFEDLED